MNETLNMWGDFSYECVLLSAGLHVRLVSTRGAGLHVVSSEVRSGDDDVTGQVSCSV